MILIIKILLNLSLFDTISILQLFYLILPLPDQLNEIIQDPKIALIIFLYKKQYHEGIEYKDCHLLSWIYLN